MPPAEPNKRQVFINCPFDAQYRELLRPLLFVLCYLGITPRIASESLNSADSRINKICKLIKISDCSIHDLSRCTSSTANEYFRMNMPFEFGIDYGMNYFNRREKQMLVLEGRRYDFQKAISDISGVDVKCHNHEPEQVVRCVRDWTIEANIVPEPDSANRIWSRFMDFTLDLYDDRKARGFSDEESNDMPTPEYTRAIQKWLKRQAFWKN